MLSSTKPTKMSASQSNTPVKDAENSPIKKRFKESPASISREDLDSAILAGVKLALAEQRAELNHIVTSAVRAALDDILLPQISDLRLQLKNTADTITVASGQIEGLEKSVQRLQARCDSTQSAVRHDRDQVNAMRQKIDELSAKLTDMEDRSRRSNLRLVGLREGEEGDDCIALLKANIPVWIPSVADRNIKIERAHRLYNDKTSSTTTRPRTIIFKLLDYTDRQAILTGARAAHPVTHKGDALHFFPDFSPDTTKKRKAFSDVRRRIEACGVQSFLIFPATLKITYRSSQILCRSPSEAEQFILANNLVTRDVTGPTPGRQRNTPERRSGEASTAEHLRSAAAQSEMNTAEYRPSVAASRDYAR